VHNVCLLLICDPPSNPKIHLADVPVMGAGAARYIEDCEICYQPTDFSLAVDDVVPGRI